MLLTITLLLIFIEIVSFFKIYQIDEYQQSNTHLERKIRVFKIYSSLS